MKCPICKKSDEVVTRPDGPYCLDCGRAVLDPSDATTCSAFHVEHHDLALAGLPKRELIRLLTLAGIPPVRSHDRQRERMAGRLARIADKITLVVEWDCRMPNAKTLP